MSDSPRTCPSQPRSHNAGCIAGLEYLPLLSEQSLSQHKPPPTPHPHPSSTTQIDDHRTATVEFAGDHRTTTNETPKSSYGSANTNTLNQQVDSEQQQLSLFRSRLVSLYHGYNPQMILENRGSTARDHLASERTFLAYVRTSLALASAGVALVQLFTSSASKAIPPGSGEASRRIQKFARPLGVSTVVMALIMLGIAMYRYFLIQVALPRNTFPVARFSVVFITFSLSAVVIVIFALLAGR